MITTTLIVVLEMDFLLRPL